MLRRLGIGVAEAVNREIGAAAPKGETEENGKATHGFGTVYYFMRVGYGSGGLERRFQDVKLALGVFIHNAQS